VQEDKSLEQPEKQRNDYLAGVKPNQAILKAARDFGRAYIDSEVAHYLGKDNVTKILVKFKGSSFKKDSVKANIKHIYKYKDPEYMEEFVAGIATESDIVNLLSKFSDEDIERIQIDHSLQLVLDDVINITGAQRVWNLGFTGNGEAVCIIDSGIDYNHLALADNYVGGYDFFNRDNDPMDDFGHGTYVSGIVAGLAPDVKIVAVKVFGENGNGYESGIMAGIDYCIRNRERFDISVILMSFGGGVFNTSCYCDSNLVAAEANLAVERGLFAIASSGNDGEAYLRAPACGTNVLSVGATDKFDEIAWFSNIEPLLDVLAPGAAIESAKLGGGTQTRSGTSASAAVVAGVAAVILEKENLSPLELQQRIRSTGFLIDYEGLDYPRIDTFAAIKNEITNNPFVQEGTQCSGTWTDYKPQYDCCQNNCAGWINGGCVGMFCDQSLCGSTCDEASDCPEYCSGPKWQYAISCESSTCSGLGDCTCNYGNYCSVADCGAQCDTGDDCNGGCNTATCMCNTGGVNCTNSNCFYIKNDTGNVVAIFDSEGDLDLRSYVYAKQTGPCTPSENSFIIKNASGNCVAYINSSGSLWLDGNLSYNQNGPCSPPDNSFVIRNASGACRAYIDSFGNMWLDGYNRSLVSTLS
jgi:subtilisin family serine protease